MVGGCCRSRVYMYDQLRTNKLIISYSMMWTRGQKGKKWEELIGVPGFAALWAIEFGPMLSCFLSLSWIWGLGLVLVSSHLPRAVGSGVCLCMCECPPTGSWAEN